MESGGLLLRVVGKDDGSAVHIGAKASGAELWRSTASLWAGRRPRLALKGAIGEALQLLTQVFRPSRTRASKLA